jgi:hypothetical protein
LIESIESNESNESNEMKNPIFNFPKSKKLEMNQNSKSTLLNFQ